MSKWEKVKLGLLTKIRTGKLDANAASEDGVYPFFTCSKAPLKISSYTYDCECVLVAGNGDLNVKYYNGKFDAYQRTYIIETKDKDKLFVPYLYTFLNSYIETLRNQSIGGVIKYIKLGNLTDAIIPLPPLETQKQIAKTLDTVLELLAMRKQQFADLDTLIKSTFYEMFGEPVTNEKEWKRLPLSEILLKIESGHSPVCLDRPAVAGEWGVLKLGAVTKCVFDPYENKALPNNEKQNPEIEIKVGDVLFSRKNTYELVAACAYVWETPPKLMMSDLIFRLVPLDTKIINPIFLQTLLSFPSKRKTIQSLAGGAAGSMPNISKTQLLKHKIEVPPLNLQNNFAAIVTEIEERKSLVRKAIDETQYLLDSLMSRYFK